MRITVLYNPPTLPPDHADYTQEAGVLEAVEAAEQALTKAGHEVERLEAAGSPAALLARLEAAPRADLIFNLCEGFAGSTAAEAHVAALLELAGVPYTGCGPECLSLVRHKARTKRLLLGAGLPTPQFLVLGPDDPLPPDEARQLLSRGPVIVKPAAEDASLGLGAESVTADLDGLSRQVASVRARYGEVLVEEFIAGREFNAGIVGWPEPQCLPLAEIEFRPDPALKWPIVTYEAKWSADSAADRATPARCPAEVEPQLAERIRPVALAAYRLTGCRDCARVDLRVSPTHDVYILEVNGNPDLSPSAGLARAVRASGLDYDAFLVRMAETAARR